MQLKVIILYIRELRVRIVAYFYVQLDLDKNILEVYAMSAMSNKHRNFVL